MATASPDWVHERTLGGHSEGFWWRLDEAGTLSFLRVHASDAGRKQQVVRAFSRDDLDQVLRFMADGAWHPAAANPSTLKADPPPSGIATFLHRTLQRSTSDAILAAQLAVVLTQAGLWEWDGRRARMRFRQASAELERVAAYFERRQADPGRRPPSERQAPTRHQRTRPQPPAFDLAASFRGRNAELRGRLEALDGGHHAPEKGQRRETALADFLRRHLPAHYGVGRAEVATPWGEISRQVDILIYDARAPLLLADAGSLILPFESVYAAIEVKPLLNGTMLCDALDTLRSVKALRAGLRPDPGTRPPIFGAVLACHSVPLDILARRLHQVQDALHPSVWLDAICILDKAVLHRHTGLPGPAGWTPAAADVPTLLACVEAGEDSLLYFHLLLLRDLQAKTLVPPDLLPYALGLQAPEPRFL